MFDKEQIRHFTTAPGVYVMKDKKARVLYVGKAKNLRNRVRQYFFSSGDKRAMIPHLRRQVETIDLLVVRTNTEALLLENTLIKKHQPKYNALFKDDKTFAGIHINTQHPWPRLSLMRGKQRRQKKGMFFGPYISVHAAKQTLELINRIFPLRQCSDRELLSRTRPCILYQMNQCAGPCANLCTQKQYESHLKNCMHFLDGKDKSIVQAMRKEMQRASNALDFEKAGQILQLIKDVEKTLESQQVDRHSDRDVDVIGYHRKDDEVLLSKLIFKQGTLVHVEHFFVQNTLQSTEDLIASFLIQHYYNKPCGVQEIVLPIALKDIREFQSLLKSKFSHPVHIFFPKRKERYHLMQMACDNSLAEFQRRKDDKKKEEQVLQTLQDLLKLDNYPSIVECYDVSHTSGKDCIAVGVVFKGGKKCASAYRKYHIRSQEKGDDYQSLKEALYRRLKRAKEEKVFPDLIVVDGGKGQLNCALDVMDQLNMSTIDLISVAKEGSRHDKGLTQEKIFSIGDKKGLKLDVHHPCLLFLQKIRDEAHRFALSFHQKKRVSHLFDNPLESIKGIGPVKARRILKFFGSLKLARKAPCDAFKKIPGLNQKDIEQLEKYFQGLL